MRKTTLKINGMMCGMCESHINDIIRSNFTVKKVSSSYKKGETVILSESDILKEQLKQVIDATGYELVDVMSEDYEKKGFFHFSR